MIARPRCNLKTLQPFVEQIAASFQTNVPRFEMGTELRFLFNPTSGRRGYVLIFPQFSELGPVTESAIALPDSGRFERADPKGISLSSAYSRKSCRNGDSYAINYRIQGLVRVPRSFSS
jgi:hypothetical protein